MAASRKSTPIPTATLTSLRKTVLHFLFRLMSLVPAVRRLRLPGDHLFELSGPEWALDSDAALTGLSYGVDSGNLFILASSPSSTVLWEAAINGTRIGSLAFGAAASGTPRALTVSEDGAEAVLATQGGSLLAFSAGDCVTSSLGAFTAIQQTLRGGSSQGAVAGLLAPASDLGLGGAFSGKADLSKHTSSRVSSGRFDFGFGSGAASAGDSSIPGLEEFLSRAKAARGGGPASNTAFDPDALDDAAAKADPLLPESLLDLHNEARWLHGARPLAWDTALTRQAAGAARRCDAGAAAGGINVAVGMGVDFVEAALEWYAAELRGEWSACRPSDLSLSSPLPPLLSSPLLSSPPLPSPPLLSSPLLSSPLPSPPLLSSPLLSSPLPSSPLLSSPLLSSPLLSSSPLPSPPLPSSPLLLSSLHTSPLLSSPLLSSPPLPSPPLLSSPLLSSPPLPSPPLLSSPLLSSPLLSSPLLFSSPLPSPPLLSSSPLFSPHLSSSLAFSYFLPSSPTPSFPVPCCPLSPSPGALSTVLFSTPPPPPPPPHTQLDTAGTDRGRSTSPRAPPRDSPTWSGKLLSSSAAAWQPVQT